MKERVNERMRFLNNLPCEITEYKEDYVRTLIALASNKKSPMLS